MITINPTRLKFVSLAAILLTAAGGFGERPAGSPSGSGAPPVATERALPRRAVDASAVAESTLDLDLTKLERRVAGNAIYDVFQRAPTPSGGPSAQDRDRMGDRPLVISTPEPVTLPAAVSMAEPVLVQSAEPVSIPTVEPVYLPEAVSTPLPVVMPAVSMAEPVLIQSAEPVHLPAAVSTPVPVIMSAPDPVTAPAPTPVVMPAPAPVVMPPPVAVSAKASSPPASAKKARADQAPGSSPGRPGPGQKAGLNQGPAGPPPAVAQPPPLPFKYAGRQRQMSGRTLYFLIKGNKLYTVEVGQVVDELYTIDGEEDGHLKMTYLPLQRTQTLSLGSPS